jgi:phospholipase C
MVQATAESDNGTHSPIKHTIILYQENISFDHYFGTYGHGSNGIPAGSTLTHTSSTGVTFGPYAPTQLLGTTQSRTCDVDHNYSHMIQMVNHGAMDQFLQFGNNKTVANPSSSSSTTNTSGDPNPIGDTCNDYPASISPQDIPNLGAEASAAGTSWAWFQGGFGTCTPTNVNGYSPHHDPFQYFTSTADLTHADAFDPNMSYPQANRHQRDLSVLDAALAGTPISGQVPVLPAISWVKAPQIDDGHPGYSGPALEDAFVGDLVSRLKASPYWKDTALVIAFDETGGWWDHVAPPELTGNFAPWVNGSPNLTGCQYPGIPNAPCGEAGLGPRMPVLVISRFAKPGFVDHDLLNTASLDKWVEWNHRLPALGVWGDRDVNAGNLAGAFIFGD